MDLMFQLAVLKYEPVKHTENMIRFVGSLPCVSFVINSPQTYPKFTPCYGLLSDKKAQSLALWLDVMRCISPHCQNLHGVI